MNYKLIYPLSYVPFMILLIRGYFIACDEMKGFVIILLVSVILMSIVAYLIGNYIPVGTKGVKK